MGSLRIAGGRVIDPAHGVDTVRDVWIVDGTIVEPPVDPDARADRTIDARGLVVMAGGVDMHCHLVGAKVNAARLLQPEDASRNSGYERGPGTRSGTLGRLPSSFATGYTYTGLGYTTAVDAAIAPSNARLAHLELRDTPLIDKAFLTLVGNDHLCLDRIRAGDRQGLREVVAWLLNATKALGIKVVNPGGVEAWKHAASAVAALDDRVPGYDISPRQILCELADAADDLGLPHPVHVHGLNLGLPGNAATTLETLRALDGRRAHLAHIQFHSYGGDPGRVSTMSSRVEELAQYIDTHPGLSVDVGQVLFGDTTALTGDSAVGHYLAQLNGRKWISHNVELETGCGVVPITYDDRNFVHALQWAIGLEWLLRVQDPWRIALSTDHPNGGSFLAYPRIIAWLMDRGLRREVLATLPERARQRTALGELDREYSFSEIAIITRAAPARLLGLRRKGQLGAGADGDLTLYDPNPDRERMFAMPRYVIKAGRIVCALGQLLEAPESVTHHASPDYDRAIEPRLAQAFERYASTRFANFAVRERDLGHLARRVTPVSAPPRDTETPR